MVTGGNGQVAEALKKLNTDLCYEFLSRSDLDICDRQAVDYYFDKIEPRLVINTAAYTAVDEAEVSSESAYRTNKLGPKLLGIACANSKTPLLHLSTDYVFDGNTKIPYAEDMKACPIGTYGKTKLGGEEAIRAHLYEHVILRLSGVFSGYSNCFPRSILKGALKNKELTIVNDQITGPTSADAIALVLDLMARKILGGNWTWGTYHFSQQPYLSWYEFGLMVIAIAQQMDCRFLNTKIRPTNSDEFSALAPRPKYACLDSSKLLGELRMDFSVLSRERDLTEAIRQIIQQL